MFAIISPLALMSPLDVILPVILKASATVIWSWPSDWKLLAIIVPEALIFPLAVILPVNTTEDVTAEDDIAEVANKFFTDREVLVSLDLIIFWSLFLSSL